jgi:8-amino-7-oxononanoate synthase
MTQNSGLFGLSSDLKLQLVAKLASRRSDPARREAAPQTPRSEAPPLGDAKVHDDIRLIRMGGELLKIENPYFRVHAGIAGAHTVIGNTRYDNFVSYNYLGLNGDPRVAEAAKAAIDRYGTSASASRITAGERSVYGELEAALAAIYGAEDCVTFVSGHATNVTVIGHLVGAEDLVLHDALSHNSIVQGAVLSGARRVSFPHNDLDELDRLLGAMRGRAKRALVIVEGHYSMDGDIPDLVRLIPIIRRHRASLMVDEAHSLGVLGTTGRGLAERCGVDPSEVDVWMGTLSKSLAGCGGYIAGDRRMVDYLRFTAPGFLYSVGMSPPVAAASLAALRIMLAEPERVAALNANATFFLAQARAAGLDTGPSIGAGIVPIVTGSSIRAARTADALFQRGINVLPIIYPAVPERSARLRFFLSSTHDQSRLAHTVAAVAEVLAKVEVEKVSLAEIAAKLMKS